MTILSSDQMAHLEDTKRDVVNKRMALNTAIDIQALLRILVDKGVITKDEISEYREEVRSSKKYQIANTYLDEMEKEISRFERDPQALLQEMFAEKMEGRK